MTKFTEKTIERLAASETKEDQFCWTFCLAELAKVAVELIPEVMSIAWSLLATRIRGVQPEDSNTKSTTLTTEQETIVFWWRNYIVVACTIVPYEPPRGPFTGSPTSPVFTSATVRHTSHQLISRI